MREYNLSGGGLEVSSSQSPTSSSAFSSGHTNSTSSRLANLASLIRKRSLNSLLALAQVLREEVGMRRGDESGSRRTKTMQEETGVTVWEFERFILPSLYEAVGEGEEGEEEPRGNSKDAASRQSVPPPSTLQQANTLLAATTTATTTATATATKPDRTRQTLAKVTVNSPSNTPLRKKMKFQRPVFDDDKQQAVDAQVVECDLETFLASIYEILFDSNSRMPGGKMQHQQPILWYLHTILSFEERVPVPFFGIGVGIGGGTTQSGGAHGTGTANTPAGVPGLSPFSDLESLVVPYEVTLLPRSVGVGVGSARASQQVLAEPLLPLLSLSEQILRSYRPRNEEEYREYCQGLARSRAIIAERRGGGATTAGYSNVDEIRNDGVNVNNVLGELRSRNEDPTEEEEEKGTEKWWEGRGVCRVLDYEERTGSHVVRYASGWSAPAGEEEEEESMIGSMFVFEGRVARLVLCAREYVVLEREEEEEKNDNYNYDGGGMMDVEVEEVVDDDISSPLSPSSSNDCRIPFGTRVGEGGGFALNQHPRDGYRRNGDINY